MRSRPTYSASLAHLVYRGSYFSRSENRMADVYSPAYLPRDLYAVLTASMADADRVGITRWYRIVSELPLVEREQVYNMIV